MATLTERLAVIIDAKTSGAVSEFRKAGAAADDLDKKTSRTGKAMQSLGLSSAATGAAMKTALVAGAAAGAAALGALGKASVDAYVGLAGDIRDFQRASGASAETSSRFVAVLDDLGVAAEVGGKAVQRLGRSSEADLRRMGVQLAENADGTANLEETLLNAADAYAATRDPAERSRLAFQLFGKQGQELIPVLEQGRAGLQAFFESAEEGRQIFSQEDLDTARRYELAMDELGDTTGGLQRQIGAGLVPALTDTVEGMSDFINLVDRGLEPIGGLESIVSTLATSTFGVASKAMQLFGDDTEQTGGAQEITAEKARELNTALSEQRRELEQATQAQQEMLNATMASFQSDLAYEMALDNLAGAQQEVTAAQQTLTEAQRVYGAQSAESKAAQDALADAERSLRGTHLDVAGAAARMAEDEAKAAGQADTARVATDAYRAELARLRDSAAPGSALRTNLDGLISRLNAASGERVVSIRAVDYATPVLNGVSRLLTDLSGRTATTTVRSTTGLLSGGLAGPPARAGGGPMRARTAYLAGENGPELVVSNTPARVMHAGDTARALGSAPNVSVRVFLGNQELRDMVRVELDDVGSAAATGTWG